MTGFEPQTSGVGSNCSTDCATTTAQRLILRTHLRQSFYLLLQSRVNIISFQLLFKASQLVLGIPTYLPDYPKVSFLQTLILVLCISQEK